MTVIQIWCSLNEFFSMCSGTQVFSWFTILEQILENTIRPVQHALKECIVSVISQFDIVFVIGKNRT